jgi:polar amino acid transport system permease protein
VTATSQSHHDAIVPPPETRAAPLSETFSRFPWWLLAVIAFITFFVVIVFRDPDYRQAFVFIQRGIKLTIIISLGSYFIAMILGLLAGLLRVSNNVILNNLGTLYVELVRGIPMLVLIFFIALVAVPGAVELAHNFGVWLQNLGLSTFLATLRNDQVPMSTRAVVALALTYGAFLAEIFRAGIQSIHRGQLEAARSLGMSYGQAMRYVILPQAIRNVLPALGNDFVAMVKDSSLVSVLAVNDITMEAKKYSGSSFRYTESYTTLIILYLSMTIVLSLLIRLLERRMRSHD